MNKLSKYKMPSVNLLKDYADERVGMTAEEHLRKLKILREVLAANKVNVEDIPTFFGPSVSEYNVVPTRGTKVSKIKELADDIAFAMGVVAVRVSIRQNSVAIEIPNDWRSIVPLKGVVCSKAFRNNQAALPLAIGYTMIQESKLIDLVDAPHILLAGATKQGKSTCLHTMVASLLFSKRPEELKMVFIDPKGVEFRAYQGLFNHYLAVCPDAASNEGERLGSIVTTAPAAANVLESLCAEMEERLEKLLKANALNFKEYNGTDMPYIVCFVDEFADLTVPIGNKEFKALARRITTAIIRLAQKGRAVGIHMILATQRPSTDVITGLIKGNFPTRIAFRTSSRIDSTIILDRPGAEALIGEGDLLLSQGADIERMQGGFISTDEVKALVDYVGSQKGFDVPYYLPMV